MYSLDIISPTSYFKRNLSGQNDLVLLLIKRSIKTQVLRKKLKKFILLILSQMI